MCTINRTHRAVIYGSCNLFDLLQGGEMEEQCDQRSRKNVDAEQIAQPTLP